MQREVAERRGLVQRVVAERRGLAQRVVAERAIKICEVAERTKYRAE